MGFKDFSSPGLHNICIKAKYAPHYHQKVAPIKYGPQCEKTCLLGFANNKGADQPAHPPSLISDFVIHLLESSIHVSKFSTFSIF